MRLPAGHTLRKKDQYGTSYDFPGALGLAPSWENGPMTDDGRYWVSACMVAHINTTGVHVPIYLTGPSPIGWGRNPDYPVQGSFVGDIFPSPPKSRYCGGRGYGSNIVKGRIGDDNQKTVPYKTITTTAGYDRCDDVCERNSTGDGYDACPVGNHIITVWRKFTSTPAISFESDKGGFVTEGSAKTSLSNPTDESISGPKYGKMGVKINTTGSGTIKLYVDAIQVE